MAVLDLFKLDGRVALVTGSNRGLGKAIAVGLAEAGADIAGMNRGDPGETPEQVQACGRRYQHFPLDLGEASVEQMQAAITDIQNAFGRLDILVNNAGIIRRASALDHSEDDWDAVMNVNLKAMFFLAQAAARVMTANGGGKIINIASMLSYQGGINVISYTVAKHGVMGITRALANEWAALKVNVNAIAPGYMETDNTVPLRADVKRNQAILDRIPAGHWGSPDELKGAAVFLASAAADYVHGTTIPVDGAWLSR